MLNPHFNPFDPPEDALPPAEVRITGLRAEPWPDGQRIRVLLSLTPFLERPNLTASISDPQGEEVAGASIVETMDIQIAFTLHIRADLQPGEYTITISLEYADLGQVDQRSLKFDPRQPLE
jgi:hypothetical protein